MLNYYADILYTSLEVAAFPLAYLHNDPANLYIGLDYNRFEMLENIESWKEIFSWFYDKIDNAVKSSDYIGFSLCYSSQVHFLLIAAKYIKTKYVNKKISVGGPLATSIIKGGDLNEDKDFFAKFSYLFDSVIIEDGELSIIDDILSCMNKGVSSQNIKIAVENCYNANIKLNLMYFFGFPTEMLSQAKETFDFIIENDYKICGIGMGSFILTVQSYVYNNYDEFGLIYVDERGNYITSRGLTQQESIDYLQECRAFIQNNYFRGHPFYHRTFYLLDISSDDSMNFPLGFTKRSRIIDEYSTKIKTSKCRISNDVLHIKYKDKYYLYSNATPFNDVFILPEKSFDIIYSGKVNLLSLCDRNSLLSAGVIEYD